MKEYIDERAAQIFEDCVSELMDIPTADVVEVVRCKDCQFWQDSNGGYPHPECRWGKDETPDADDYCSFGERREDNA